jgi:hypothetical protein
MLHSWNFFFEHSLVTLNFIFKNIWLKFQILHDLLTTYSKKNNWIEKPFVNEIYIVLKLQGFEKVGLWWFLMVPPKYTFTHV